MNIQYVVPKMYVYPNLVSKTIELQIISSKVNDNPPRPSFSANNAPHCFGNFVWHRLRLTLASELTRTETKESTRKQNRPKNCFASHCLSVL